MLYQAIRSGLGIRDILISLLITVPIILVTLTVHEVAHGYVSYKLGDPTAYNLGRLTLNPIKHLDPLGSLSMLLFGIGWAKPVPVNARYYKKPKWGMALTAIAGPLSNVLLAFVGMILYVCLRNGGFFGLANSDFSYSLLSILYTFLQLFITMNAYLAIFNLLPIPPFDGSRIAFVFLPDKVYFGVMRYERIIMLATMFLLFTGFLSVPLNFLAYGLTGGMEWLVNTVWNAVALLFR